MNRESFLQAVIERPDDDAPRLVFADWLEENGEEERAEFIRVQCELARLAHDDPRAPTLEDRELELLGEYEEEWLGELPRYLFDCRFERGFLEGFSTSTCTLVEAGDLLARHPIRRIQLQPTDAYIPGPVNELAAQPWLGRLETLELKGWEMDTAAFAPLLLSPHLTGLRSLSLSGTNGGELPETLARCPSRSRLHTLDCSGVFTGIAPVLDVLDSMSLTTLGVAHCRLTAAHLRALLARPCSSRLTELRLGNNRFGPDAHEALQQLPVTARLQRLDVTKTALAGDGLGPMLAAPGLAHLRALTLNAGSLEQRHFEALARSAFWGQAEELRMQSVSCTAEALQPLCRPEATTNLRVLDLALNPIGPQGIRHLCDAPFAGRLGSLNLAGSSLTDESLAILADSGRFGRLRSLVLQSNSARPANTTGQITDAGIERLARASSLAGLRSLNLYMTDITGRAIDALLNGSNMVLHKLNVGCCGLRADAVAVLARSRGLARLRELTLGFNKDLGGRVLLPLARSRWLSPACRLDLRFIDVDESVRAAFRERLGRGLIA